MSRRQYKFKSQNNFQKHGTNFGCLVTQWVMLFFGVSVSLLMSKLMKTDPKKLNCMTIYLLHSFAPIMMMVALCIWFLIKSVELQKIIKKALFRTNNEINVIGNPKFELQ